jgi:hypothetical protein
MNNCIHWEIHRATRALGKPVQVIIMNLKTAQTTEGVVLSEYRCDFYGYRVLISEDIKDDNYQFY